MSKKHEELNKGAWTAQEDKLLVSHVNAAGEGKWNSVPKKAGLKRCGKSCRLRWKNYLRPNIKRGNFSEQEEDLIYRLHKLLGNRWSLIAGRLPGRTDNEIKNYWNTTLSKKMQSEKFAMEPPCNNTNAWKETQKSQYGSNNKEPLPPSCSKCKNDTSLIPTKSFYNPNNLPLQKSSYVTEKQQQYLQDVEEALMQSEEDMTTFDNDLLDFDGAVSFDGLNFESMNHRDDIGDDIVMLDADSETFDLW